MTTDDGLERRRDVLEYLIQIGSRMADTAHALRHSGMLREDMKYHNMAIFARQEDEWNKTLAKLKLIDASKKRRWLS